MLRAKHLTTYFVTHHVTTTSFMHEYIDQRGSFAMYTLTAPLTVNPVPYYFDSFLKLHSSAAPPWQRSLLLKVWQRSSLYAWRHGQTE